MTFRAGWSVHTLLIVLVFCVLCVSTLPLTVKVTDTELNENHKEFYTNTLKFRPYEAAKFKKTSNFGHVLKMNAYNPQGKIPLSTSTGGNYQNYKEPNDNDYSWKEKGFVSKVECDICKLVVFAVQSLVAQGKSEKEIAAAITTICTDFHIEDKRVCTYVVQEFKDEVLTVLEKLVLSPSEICGLALGSECAHVYNPYTTWNITLPDTPKPPVTPPTPPKPGSPTIRIIQLSDIHVDFRYKPGSNAECGEPVCCHGNDGSPKGAPAGQWGDYRQCDTPTWTLENVFKRIATEEKFDYIYWTGDLPGHSVWNQSRVDQQKLQRYLTGLFIKYFPGKPIFPSVGNHESAPVNSFPPPFVRGDQSIEWLYQTLASNWSHWLPNSSLPDILKGGYYTVLVRPGFRIVSINTNYCNNENWWLFLNTTDPANELQWLIKVLQAAEDNHEKVHILGHIPTGLDCCLKSWSWNYYKIINRYESTVTAQFFGHTHTDYFNVYYDDIKFQRPVSVAYVSPSVTTYASEYGTNPSYRIYDVDGGYDKASWYVLNHQTYMFNLSEANLSPNLPPRWELEYDAKMAYNMTGLYPEDWHGLLQRMKTDDKLFKKYYQYYYHGHPPKGTCDKKCREAKLCEARCGRSHDQGHMCKDIQN